MKLRKIRLVSFLDIGTGDPKSFESGVPEDTCILIGRNGCGKSILLEGLAFLSARSICPALNELRRSMDQFGNRFVETQFIADFDFCDFAVAFRQQPSQPAIMQQMRKTDSVGRVLYIPPSRDFVRPNPTINNRNFDSGNQVSVFGPELRQHFEETLVSISNREIQAKHHNLGEVAETQTLKRIRDAYRVMFPEIELLGAFGHEFLAKKNGNSFSISSLSHGEKQALILFSFVAKEADLSNSILLIDEPDIGLSRELKKRLLPSLRALNLGMQIIVATHSAEIIESVSPAKLLPLTD